MLRFDGRLIVDSAFETSLKDVYAAGPAAKFSRNDCPHTRHNSVEIGARAAGALMELLNVAEDGGKDAEFVRPLTVYCRLPGKYNYLHAAVPGARAATADKTRVLKTGNAAGEKEYFELVVDGGGDVLELSCYSKRVGYHRKSFDARP